MWGSYTAELMKLRKRGATWVLFAAGIVLSLTFGYLLPYLGYVTGDANQQTQGIPPEEVLAGLVPAGVIPNTIGGFAVFAGALALAFGALVTGGEYGWGTMKTLLTQRPTRTAVLVSQFLALATMILAWVLMMFAACLLVSVGIGLAEGESLALPPAAEIVTGLAAGWLVLLTWTLGGAILGVGLRGVALPIGLGIVWVLGVENLVTGVAASLFPDLEVVSNVLPGVNAGALVYAVLGSVPTDVPPGVSDAVSGGRALVTLLVYGAVFAAGSVALVRRRDVV